jgi:hypothetical protein
MIRYAYSQFATERFPLPSEEQVLALEKRIGLNLPADYRDYILNFNGGYFSEPEIETDDEESGGDGLHYMFGIDSGHECSELADSVTLSIFEEIGPMFFPIGYTALGGFIVIVIEEADWGTVYLKKAWGDFHYLADDVEEFFGLLREWPQE